MKKAILLILVIGLFSGCSKEDYFSFETIRTDLLYHNDLLIYNIQHEPHYFIRYNISRLEAEKICRIHTYPLPIKKVVSPIKVFGVVYSYYDLKRSQTCKIRK